LPEIGPGPAKTAFQEAALAATELAAAEQFGVQPEKPRNEKGQFSPETPVVEEAPAPEAEVASEVVESTSAEKLHAGKYKSVEELERGYLELQQFTARQGTDVGEQRALAQALAERLAVLESKADAPARQNITPDFIEQNPGAAAQLAYEQGDQTALGAAYQQWSLEDPAAAATWVGERRLQEARQEFEQRAKQLEDRFIPFQQAQEQSQLTQGVQQLPEDVRSFLTDVDAVQSLATEFPTLGNAIVSGSPSERLNAIQALHGIHRGRTADTLGQAASDVARAVAQEAQAVRDEAYVASSTSSQEEPQSYEQQEQQRMTDYAAKRATPFGGGLVVPGK
jgi:hypothetical protein